MQPNLVLFGNAFYCEKIMVVLQFNGMLLQGRAVIKDTLDVTLLLFTGIQACFFNSLNTV